MGFALRLQGGVQRTSTKGPVVQSGPGVGVGSKAGGFVEGAGELRSRLAGKLSAPFSQRVFRRGVDVNKWH
jgi:hypothetical protein